MDLMQFARCALQGQYPGKLIRRSVLGLVRQAASGDLVGACRTALKHLSLVKDEKSRADQAARLVEIWAQDHLSRPSSMQLQVGQVAQLLNVSRDMLRNWERNGLLEVSRNPTNGYRQYTDIEIKRLQVIWMLSQAGYSQMAILRMMVHLDRGRRKQLKRSWILRGRMRIRFQRPTAG